MVSPLRTDVGYGAYAAYKETASAAFAGANAVIAGFAVLGQSSAVSGTGTADAASGVSASGVSGSDGTSGTKSTECETCRNRKYQDISTDAGVSFKAPANIDPSVAASSVMAHEKEHIALAEGRAAESGGQVISSVTLETSICEECGRVYVSGGKAHITTITPVEKKAAEKEDAPASVGPGRSSDGAKVDFPGMPAGRAASPNLATGTALPGKMVLDDGGADLFRKIYKQTMTGNFGLFFDAKA